jgi:Ran-binding protein 9/10
MYVPPPGPPHGSEPKNSSINPGDDDPTPTYAPPAYPPPFSDPTPSTPHPVHPAYIPPPDPSAPPQWEASAGELRVAQLYPYGLYHDAGKDNFERCMRFCEMYPNVNMAQYITYQQLDLIRTQGIGAWTLTLPSQFDGKLARKRDGTTEVKSNFLPSIDKTIISSFPVLWGRYHPREGAKGVYYEVEIEKLGRDAVVAVGFGCLPYPTDFRLPGWHRHSAAVHSDDGFKFFENSDGGVPFMNPIRKKG